MRLRVGCAFDYETAWPTPSVMLVQPHPENRSPVVEETWSAVPSLYSHEYRDPFNNRCRRFMLPPGATTLRYDAQVDVSGDPDEVAPLATQFAVEELPDDVLTYTLASRYCLSDALSATAWHLFGGADLGWGRVQAVCDWINANIRYGLHSTPLTTALDVYVAQGGMCRDFAHLAVTFCRALNIPARYVFGYMPDVSLPPPYPPMDFHAWFEVYLRGPQGGRWYTFDARFNRPLIGRIPIGHGRDAVDVAMMTTYGAAQFRRMTVWCDVVGAASTPPTMLVGISDDEADTTAAGVVDRQAL